MSEKGGADTGELMVIDDIQSRIYTIRGVQVMLDEDLADLYGVEVRVLNQSVKRNIDRFPEEFRFQLSTEENEVIKSQIVTLKSGRGRHRKYLPNASASTMSQASFPKPPLPTQRAIAHVLGTLGRQDQRVS